jgi:cell division protein FtsL
MIEEFKKKLKAYGNYFLVLVSVLMLVSLFRNILKVRQVNERIEKKKLQLEKLQSENEKLKKEVARVKSEEFIEKQLRDKLGLAKEGEIVVVLPDKETLRAFAPNIEEEEETLPLPNWKKWLQLFLN